MSAQQIKNNFSRKGAMKNTDMIIISLRLCVFASLRELFLLLLTEEKGSTRKSQAMKTSQITWQAAVPLCQDSGRLESGFFTH